MLKVMLTKKKKEVILIFFSLLIFVIIKVFCFPVYEAATVIMIDIKKGPTSIEAEKMDLRENIGYVRIHIELLKSQPVLESVTKELKLYEDTFEWGNLKYRRTNITDIYKEKTIRKALENLQKKYISIDSPPFTNLIEIKVKYKNAEKAAQIANILVKNYMNWSVDFLHLEVNNILDYLNKEVEVAKERLLKSEEDLKKFREENKVISLSDEIKAHFQVIPEEMKAHFQVIQAMEIKLLELEVELSRLKELYTEDSPQVIYMKKRISQLKDELDNEIKKSKSTEDYVSKLINIPEKEITLARLMRDVKINETLYTFLLQEQEKSRLLKAKQTTENIKVVSPALVPLKPKGRLANLLIGSVISLTFAIGLPFFFEYRKKLFKRNSL